MQVKFYKVSTLPQSPEPNSFYYIENGEYAEAYLTDNQGNAREIGNTTMTNDIVSRAVMGFNSVKIVANITERDILTAAATANNMILVIDATDDPTVETGSALYAYNYETTTTYKVSEYESLDMIIPWEMIQDKPYNSVEDIDDAVNRRHSHANKAVLDKWGESDTELPLYSGRNVDAMWKTNEW